jgi:hypothetical protein
MSALERAALEHVAEEMAYRRSGQAERDRKAGIADRAAYDRKCGHLPECGLIKCAPGCPRLQATR